MRQVNFDGQKVHNKKITAVPGGQKNVNIWPLFHCNKGQILTLFFGHPVKCAWISLIKKNHKLMIGVSSLSIVCLPDQSFPLYL
jgi:hypothetical protein